MATAARTSARRPLSAMLPSATDLLPVVLSFVVLLGGWELLGQTLHQDWFPPISAVIAKLIDVRGQILDALGTSLLNLVFGFAMALVIGIGLGLMMGAFRKLDAALDIYINALLSAPSLVFAPVFFAIWGLGRESIIAVIVMYSTWIMVVNTVTAIRTVSVELIEMGTSFNAPRWKMWTRILLPAATPLIMAGVRLGIGRAVKGMVNGEMFIAIVGLGRLVEDGSRGFDSTLVLAVLIVIVVVAFVAVYAVQLLDSWLTRWLPKTSR